MNLSGLKKLLLAVVLVLIVVMLKSCATPMGPSGGERDEEGPNIVGTEPENGTTNFSGDEVTFEFDQFIERNSFRDNVTVEPDLGIEFEMDFGRKSATVEFLSPLPENTTIIVKVGTEVTDTDRNEMDAPFDLALSTGDVLDDATVTARLLNFQTGKGEKGNRVFLYPEPFDLTQRSRYVAETDTSGLIQFGYLGEGTYKAFLVNDVNRNRIWEPERENAQPFQSEIFELARDDSIDIGTLYIDSPDTLAPEVDGVGLLSQERLRLRASEEVIWEDDAEFILTDTLENEYTRAVPLYKSEQDPTVLFAQPFRALVDTMQFLIQANGVTDNAGNSLRIDVEPFIGSAQEDTTALETISHNSGSGLFPDEALEVTYSTFIDDDSVIDSLVVVEGDTETRNWAPLEVANHILRISPPEGNWEPGISYEFRVWNPWLQEREQINPDIWQRNQLGGVELTLENGDSTVTSNLTLTDTEASILVDTTFTNSIFIDNLPPLEYKAIVYEDVNGDGQWNAGTVVPFMAPEPYTVRTQIPVREGFTAEVSVSYPNKESDTEQTVSPENEEDENSESSEPNDNNNP
ncbi:MAG: Ig-like domain-containing protein [Balneolaceae bacterium]|nr:Ig-like domain-containing protein [Balneolaceae bacterium]MDR9407545.1 Ig-like domain-containing protein [Balneolaceae bacterium]